MHEIIPGILEKEWSEIEKKINLVLPFAKTIHIDLLDGKFADNTTFLDPAPFAKYKDTVKLELHMMVDDPMQYLETWAQAGFSRFLGHIERMPDQEAFVAKARMFGEAGLALDGGTPASTITVPLDTLDTVLIMAINAGFSGQSYMSKREDVMRDIRAKRSLPMEVDGGINEQTITQARDAGATRFVTTSFLFRDDPVAQYRKLGELLS